MENPLPAAASVFHEGEVAVQKRAGYNNISEKITERIIRPFMPDQHREFFGKLPAVMLGLADSKGDIWCVPAVGQPGFMKTPDDRALEIGALPLLRQAIDPDIEKGSKIGIVGLEFATRRRNRMNGSIVSAGESGLSIRIEQSFGNCPQYIQKRDLQFSSVMAQNSDNSKWHKTDVISDDARRIVATADTFFIASRTSHFSADPRTGIDASHRGGKPGFVKVDEKGTLYFPDFSGNRFFNTLGNIHADGRVGLFFCSFETGEVVCLTGRAKILWDGILVDGFSGVQRVVEIVPLSIIHAKNIWPLTGELVETWPRLKSTGSWS